MLFIFLDPNHPATNKGLLSLISSGHPTRAPQKTAEDTKNILQQQQTLIQDQQLSQLELLQSQFQVMGYSDEQVRETMALYEQQFQLQREQLQAQMQAADIMPKKILHNALYLMVANLPSEEELEAVETMTRTEENRNGDHISIVTMVNI